MVNKSHFFGFSVLFLLLFSISPVSAEWVNDQCGVEDCGGETCTVDEMCQKEFLCNTGDVNEDGIINILDVILSVNIVLGGIVPTPGQLCAADYNQDSILNILDVVGLVNYIIGDSSFAGPSSIVGLESWTARCEGMMSDVRSYMQDPSKRFAMHLRNKYINCARDADTGRIVIIEEDSFWSKLKDYFGYTLSTRPQYSSVQIGGVGHVLPLPSSREDIFEYQCITHVLCTNTCADTVDNDRDGYLNDEGGIHGDDLGDHSVEEGCENFYSTAGSDDDRSRPLESVCKAYFNADSEWGVNIADLDGLCTSEQASESCNPWQGKVALTNLAFGLNNNALCYDEFEWCCIDVNSDDYNELGTIGPYDFFRFCGDGYCQGWVDGDATEDPDTDLLSGWSLTVAESYYNCYWEDAEGTVNHDCTVTGLDCDYTSEPSETADCVQGNMAQLADGTELLIDWVDNGAECTYGQRTRSCIGYHWGNWNFCNGNDPTEYGAELNCEDNNDNDCDGYTDSQDSDCGICEMGDTINQTCGTTDDGLCTLELEYADCHWDGDSYSYDSWYGCNAIEPQDSEICNDVNGDDEDCNGFSNDGEPEACGDCDLGDTITQECGTTSDGLCTMGSESADCGCTEDDCAYGAWYGCDAIEPQDSEICDDANGDDEDCDGTANSNEADGECGVCVDGSQDSQACGYDYLGGSNYGLGSCTEGTEYRDCSWDGDSSFNWGSWHDGSGNVGVCGAAYVGPSGDVCDNGADENCDGTPDDNCYSEFFNFFITSPSDFGNNEVADESSVAYNSLLATADGNGAPVIAYYSGTNDKDFMFAKYVGPFDATAGTQGSGNCGYNAAFQLIGNWQCDVLDQDAGASNSLGAENSMVIDDSGIYHVAYTEADFIGNFPPQQLVDIKYAKYIGGGAGNCYGGSDWSCTYIEDLFATVTTQTRYDSPIVFLVGDVPHIIYTKRYPAPDQIKHATYVGAAGNCGNGEWNCEVVVEGVNIHRVSADYDSVNSLIHVAFSDVDDLSNKIIRYAYATPGGAWTVSDIDSRGQDQVYRSRLSIKASDDSLHVAYPYRFNGTNALTYATKSLTGGSWTLRNLSNCAAYYPQIAINSEGEPRINAWSWSCGGDDLDTWYYYTLDGDWADGQRVEQGDFATYINGQSGSIIIDDSNKPHLSYMFNYFGADVLRYSTMLPV